MVKDNSAKNILITLFIILVLCSIVFLLISRAFSPSFVIRYSPDGILKESTLHKIYFMKQVFFYLSLAPLVIIALLSFAHKKSLAFIHKRKKLILNLLLLCFTLILLLALSEATLWILLKNETSFTSAGPPSIAFNQNYVRMNEAGFRDDQFSAVKDEGITRIAIVGDSVSFGSGIRNVKDTYPEILEARLNDEEEKTYEVYNFGIPGYDTDDQRETIEEKVLTYNPDILIIAYYENDIENVDEELHGWEDVPNWEIPVIGFWLRESSYTYYFFESRFNRAAENIGVKKRWLDTLETTYASEANRKYNKAQYAEIAQLAEENNIKVVLVAFPVVSDFENYQFFIVRDFAQEIAEENNFAFIDLYDTYSEYTPEELVVNKYDYHPNELGHKIAAEKILEELREKDILSE